LSVKIKFKPYTTDLHDFTDLLSDLVYPTDKITQKTQLGLVFITVSFLWCNNLKKEMHIEGIWLVRVKAVECGEHVTVTVGVPQVQLTNTR
jgi:hypothetical protein